MDGNSNKNVKNDRFNKQNNNFAGVDYIVSFQSFPQVLAKPSFLVFGGQGVKRSPRLPAKRPSSSSGELLLHDVKFPYATFYGGSKKKEKKNTNSSFFFLTCICSIRIHF